MYSELRYWINQMWILWMLNAMAKIKKNVICITCKSVQSFLFSFIYFSLLHPEILYIIILVNMKLHYKFNEQMVQLCVCVYVWVRALQRHQLRIKMKCGNQNHTSNSELTNLKPLGLRYITLKRTKDNHQTSLWHGTMFLVY